MFQSYIGPSDPLLPRSEVEGYQPVSRIGEVVVNAFVDAHEFALLDDHISFQQMTNKAPNAADAAEVAHAKAVVEYKPPFHEWASALPGMIALSRKKRSTNFRSYTAAETAAPVIVASACQKKEDENSFFFSGIVRSKSVRVPDDGRGATTDEYFTLSIGGMATILNNSDESIFPGDMLEWTFLSDTTASYSNSVKTAKRSKTLSPRRVGVKQCADVNQSNRVIGRALSYGKKGESIDILIRAC